MLWRPSCSGHRTMKSESAAYGVFYWFVLSITLALIKDTLHDFLPVWEAIIEFRKNTQADICHVLVYKKDNWCVFSFIGWYVKDAAFDAKKIIITYAIQSQMWDIPIWYQWLPSIEAFNFWCSEGFAGVHFSGVSWHKDFAGVRL